MCVCFRTFVICLSCRLFIPLAFVSYPNELFSYLLQHFHTILVYFKTYGLQLVWLSTAIVFFHTLGICFIPKWPGFIPSARFSYLFGIIQTIWCAIVWLSTAMIFLSVVWPIHTTQVRFQGRVRKRVCDVWRCPRMLAVEACRVTWCGHQS